VSSPIIWGPNGTSKNLQNQTLTASGELMQNNGDKNYITYNNFENQLTTGWGLGTTGTLTNGIPTGSPTFGSGASGNLSLTTSTSSPIAGTTSLSLVSSAATTAGDMLHTNALTIDSADQAKVITGKFYYTVPANPTNGNFSGTSSNSFGIAAYDVTNSSWLPVVGNFAMTQNAGVGIATVTMQTNLTTASVRFVIYNANASAGAITVNFDRFYLGPQTAPIGPVITDSALVTTLTGAGLGTLANTSIRGGRVGNRWVVQGTITTGTVTAVNAALILPPGMVIDTTKFTAASNTQKVGEYRRITGGTSQDYQVGNAPGGTVGGLGSQAAAIFYDGSTTDRIFIARNFTSSAYNKEVANNFLGSNEVATIEFDIPIAGWSSNVQMSNDTDTRVVAARYAGSVSSISSTSAAIAYSTKYIDTHAAYSGSTYTIPVTGIYRITASANIVWSNATANSSSESLYIYKNGSEYSRYFQYASASAAGQDMLSVSDIINCNAGETIQIFGSSNFTGPTIANDPARTFFSIDRISGPAVIAAVESISAHYQATGGQTVNTTPATIIFNTKVYDSHNAMNSSTGVYTAPVSGKYRVSVSTLTNGTSYTTTQDTELYVAKNGTTYSWLGRTFGNGAVINMSVNGSTTVQCNAGDTISATYYSTVSNSLATPLANYITIERCGN
jgi:hypothetical protein